MLRSNWFLGIIFLFVLVGCRYQSASIDLSEKTLQTLYPNDLSQVDHVEIRSGSTGELKVFRDKEQIQEWLTNIKDLQLKPDPNQEDRAGFLYGVSLFEKDQRIFSFSNGSIQSTYYLENKTFNQALQSFFESQQKDF